MGFESWTLPYWDSYGLIGSYPDLSSRIPPVSKLFVLSRHRSGVVKLDRKSNLGGKFLYRRQTRRPHRYKRDLSFRVACGTGVQFDRRTCAGV